MEGGGVASKHVARDGMRDVALADDGEPDAGKEVGRAGSKVVRRPRGVGPVQGSSRAGGPRRMWNQPGGWQHPAVHCPDLMVSLFENRADGPRPVANDIVTGEQRWDITHPTGAPLPGGV